MTQDSRQRVDRRFLPEALARARAALSGEDDAPKREVAEQAHDVILATLALSLPAPAGSTRSRLWNHLERTGDLSVHAEAAAAGLGGLFTRAARATIVSPGRALVDALKPLARPGIPGAALLGAAHEVLLAAPDAGPAPAARGGSARGQWGSHYTPYELAMSVVSRALSFLPPSADPPSICDPALGGGIFLLALAEALSARTGREIASLTPWLHGVDRDPRAVDVARFALYVAAAPVDERDLPVDVFGARLVVGDALLLPPLGLDWEATFPDVFRARGGFDLFVGNPPFVGGKRIATHLGRGYPQALRGVHPDASGNVDLSAHFFRRAFDLLRPGGALGFVTTSAIAKGDTREGGLDTLCARGATIVSADRALRWPGAASVRISVVHLVKGPSLLPRHLDGAPVDHISAALEPSEQEPPPPPLPANAGIAFVGCYLRGMGFTFDDTSDEAMPIALRTALLARSPHLALRVPAYLGGDEVSREPAQRPHRYVLDVNDLDLADAPAHPELFALVERYVRPARERLPSETGADRLHRRDYHRWANPRPELRRAMAGLARVLVTPRVSSRRFFAFLSTEIVPSEQLVVFALPTFAAFALLQSVVHDVWTRAFASSFGQGIRYTPSDVFETFPLPPGFRHDPRLERAGRALYEARADILLSRRIGLGALYRNLGVHADMPSLHRAIDAAALAAYGFDDVDPASLSRDPPRTDAHRALVARLRAVGFRVS